MKKEKLFGVALLVFAVVKLTERPRYIVPPATPSGNLQNNYAAWLAYAQNVYKQAVALYGSIQNAINVLWGPGGPFEKTPIPEYDAGTLFWGEVEGGGVARIGHIFKTIPPGKTPYMDGSFSDNIQKSGICSYHGGSLLTTKKKSPRQEVAPAEQIENFIERRASEIAKERKEDARTILKRTGGAPTQTAFNSILKRTYDFNYDHYKYGEGRKHLIKEYAEIYPNIGAIYPEIPALYECNDGTYSTSHSPRGCGRHGGKKSGDKTEITFDGTYMVQKDTSGSGVITIQLIPTDQLQKELESKLGELQAEVANIDLRINELQDRKKSANREIKEIEKLQGKLQSAPKSVKSKSKQ